MSHDPRVDAYIRDAQPFARPILARIRNAVHAGCPQAGETIKWGMPFFEYKGLFCNMAAFKAHCAFGFWRGAFPASGSRQEGAMGQFGRVTSLADLPPQKALVALVREAAATRDVAATLKPVRGAARSRAPKPALEPPPDLAAALRKDRRARAAFDAFPPSHRREYVEWILDAKTAPTRERRIATAVEWIGQGKGRNWKYER